ncbi:MAG: hypothetical protein COB22_05200 [Cycloclasticus sp.]|nr:MAG: hypothetical protein COB22_05200 [Cycloclasticus sp.]
MNSLTKNRLKLVFITVLFALPVITAWLVFSNPQWLEGGDTKNNGELITPAMPSNISDFVMTSDDTNLDHLKGRWVLIHLDFNGSCNAGCEKSVHMLKQLHTLLNKDSNRLERVYLDKSMTVNSILAKDTKLTVLKWNEANLNTLNALVKELKDDDMLLLDPLGNIMMKYHHDADPYGIQKDLKLLFKASQIG